MTNIVFYKENSRHIGFSLSGHACFNTGGPDILCSAISMACQMTANGLESVAKVETCVEERGAYFSVMIEGESNEIAEALIESFVQAVENLYCQYSRFITLSRVERGE